MFHIQYRYCVHYVFFPTWFNGLRSFYVGRLNSQVPERTQKIHTHSYPEIVKATERESYSIDRQVDQWIVFFCMRAAMIWSLVGAGLQWWHTITITFLWRSWSQRWTTHSCSKMLIQYLSNFGVGRVHGMSIHDWTGPQHMITHVPSLSQWRFTGQTEAQKFGGFTGLGANALG